MTINFIGEQFVKGRSIKGAYMSVDNYGDKTVLSYRYNRNNEGTIAEIVDRKENGDFTLILHPRPNSWGKTSHNNRIWGVLIALAGENRRDIRYTSFVRYNIIIADRKLDVEYALRERPIKFNYKGGQLLIDYKDLESHAVPPEERTAVVAPNSNNNIKNEMERLNTILATV